MMARAHEIDEEAVPFSEVLDALKLAGGQIVRIDPEDIRDSDYLTWGRWEEVKDDPLPTDYLLPAYSSGSDYSGNLVEKSNHDYWIQNYGDEPGGLIEVSGGYSTYGVLLPLGKLNEAMLEDLHRLENYPLLDENLHSELEMESQNESYPDALRDFRRKLEEQVGDEVSRVLNESEGIEGFTPTDDDPTDLADAAVETLSDEALGDIFRDAAETSNENWINEEGPSSYIDVDKVAKGIDPEVVSQLTRLALRDFNIPMEVLSPPFDPRQVRLPGVNERRGSAPVEIDNSAVTELLLYVENDGDLYRQQTVPIMKNLARKMVNGTYDSARAVDAWMYLADSGAKKYTMEFGGFTAQLKRDIRGRQNGAFGIFGVPERRAVAVELAKKFEDEIKNNEHDIYELAKR